MITFSFRPRRWSTLPLIAASVDARGLLEARRRDERVGAERRLGDAEQQWVAGRRLLAFRRETGCSR